MPPCYRRVRQIIPSRVTRINLVDNYAIIFIACAERKPSATRGFRHPIHFHETIRSTRYIRCQNARVSPRIIIINGIGVLLSDAAFSSQLSSSDALINSALNYRWISREVRVRSGEFAFDASSAIKSAECRSNRGGIFRFDLEWRRVDCFDLIIYSNIK